MCFLVFVRFIDTHKARKKIREREIPGTPPSFGTLQPYSFFSLIGVPIGLIVARHFSDTSNCMMPSPISTLPLHQGGLLASSSFFVREVE